MRRFWPRRRPRRPGRLTRSLLAPSHTMLYHHFYRPCWFLPRSMRLILICRFNWASRYKYREPRSAPSPNRPCTNLETSQHRTVHVQRTPCSPCHIPRASNLRTRTVQRTLPVRRNPHGGSRLLPHSSPRQFQVLHATRSVSSPSSPTRWRAGPSLKDP